MTTSTATGTITVTDHAWEYTLDELTVRIDWEGDGLPASGRWLVSLEGRNLGSVYQDARTGAWRTWHFSLGRGSDDAGADLDEAVTAFMAVYIEDPSNLSDEVACKYCHRTTDRFTFNMNLGACSRSTCVVKSMREHI